MMSFPSFGQKNSGKVLVKSLSDTMTYCWFVFTTFHNLQGMLLIVCLCGWGRHQSCSCNCSRHKFQGVPPLTTFLQNQNYNFSPNKEFLQSKNNFWKVRPQLKVYSQFVNHFSSVPFAVWTKLDFCAVGLWKQSPKTLWFSSQLVLLGAFSSHGFLGLQSCIAWEVLSADAITQHEKGSHLTTD